MTKKVLNHLTSDERKRIALYKELGKSHREISKIISRSHTTINNECKRNSIGRKYDHKIADDISCERRHKASSIIRRMTGEILDKVQSMLFSTQASPAQISGRLRKIHGLYVSAETIYRYIWADKDAGGKFYKHLRHKAKKYNKRSNNLAGRGVIPRRKDISERPIEVESKSRIGDFELDTIIGAGRQGAIVSIVDRASKYVFLKWVSQPTSAKVCKEICASLRPLKKHKLIHTLTSDNGKEFSSHEKITKALGGKFYFARPYCSWDRGLNEHTNGLVRQYLPKKTNFSTLTKQALRRIEQILNNRPRKILNFATPCEVLFKATGLNLGGNFQN